MVKTAQQNLVYYIAETPLWGYNQVGTNNTPDDGLWNPLLEVQSISGRAKNQEIKSVYRHGARIRGENPALGKITPEDLVFEMFMVDDDPLVVSIDCSSVQVDFDDTGNPDTITRASGSWITDGLGVGSVITVAGSTSNDGTYTVATLTATVLTLILADSLVAETNTTTTITFTVASLNFYDTFLISTADDFDESFAVSSSYTFFIPDNVSTPSSSTDFEYYYGCVLKELEISISEGDPNISLTATFDVQYYVFSATELHTSTGAVYSAHPSSITYLLWTDASFVKTGFTNNTNLYKLQEFSMTINQNYEKVWTISGTRYACDHFVGAYEVSGSFTNLYNNLTELHDEFDDLDGIITVGISRTTSSISMALSDLTFDSLSLDSATNEMQTVDAEYTARRCAFA
jgi:hypothetical protein